LLSAARGPAPALRHSPSAHFIPGEPLHITFAVERATSLASARLLYRHVDQAEEYQSIDLTEQSGELRAAIPAAYTASNYPLQYFLELQVGHDRAHRYPGFVSEVGNQPYFVVYSAGERRFAPAGAPAPRT
jgi:rhodanese-related sulfurtransferase